MKIDISINSQEVAEKMLERTERITSALSAKMQALDVMLQRYIIEEKFQGQALQERTGQASRSVRTMPLVVDGNQMSGGVTAGGATAFYLKWQEDGTTPGEPWIIEAKNAKALAFMPGPLYGPFTQQQQRLININRSFDTRSPAGPLTKNQARLLDQKRAMFNQAGGVIVKSVLHPPLIARHFMRDALLEKQDDILQGIQEAVREAVK